MMHLALGYLFKRLGKGGECSRDNGVVLPFYGVMSNGWRKMLIMIGIVRYLYYRQQNSKVVKF